MSHSQPKSMPLGATPGKLALIAVLAVVMMGVVISNWPSAAAPPVEESALETPPPVEAATTDSSIQAQPSAPAGPFGEFAEDRHWPELPIKEVTKFDPFAESPWAAPPKQASDEGSGPAYSQEQINELLAAKNAIIFVAGDRRVARIGDEEFQIGDILGHYKITDITPKGVVLSEVSE
jgi:hypothetical protein